MRASPTVLVRLAKEGDREALLDVLGRVYDANMGYPARIDTDGSVASLETWLLRDTPLARWVASVDDDQVGHVLVHEPGQYLISRQRALFLNPNVTWLEIGKLFADPLTPGLDVGGALLSTARTYIADLGARAVLCVLDTSESALRLYVREGMAIVGEFLGVHGRNIVMTD